MAPLSNDPPPVIVAAESVPPPGAVPVISVSPAPEGKGHIVSLAPGARIVQDAPPPSPAQRAVELAPVLLAMVVAAVWGALQPTLIPILVGLVTTGLAFAYRKRPAREFTLPSLPGSSSSSSSTPTPVPPAKRGGG